eukprot:scaffold37596_cov40-Tisochrysis_lutea.AAC.1
MTIDAPSAATPTDGIAPEATASASANMARRGALRIARGVRAAPRPRLAKPLRPPPSLPPANYMRAVVQ